METVRVAVVGGRDVEDFSFVPDKFEEVLLKEIIEERRRAVAEGREELIDYASDREVLMVLCEASLNAPIRSEYVEIYQYLMTRVFGDRVPHDLRKETLSDYERQILTDLKREIRNRQWRALEKTMRKLRKKTRKKALV